MNNGTIPPGKAYCKGINEHNYTFTYKDAATGIECGLAVVSIVMGLFGALSNMYIIYVLVRCKLNQTKSLFISMAITDVLGAAGGVYLGYILLNNFDGSNYNPKVVNYIMGCSYNIIAMITPVLMCLITSVRFLGVFCPRIYRKYQLHKIFLALQICTWILIVSVNLYIAIKYRYVFNRPYPDAYLGGQFRGLYYVILCVLIYSVVAIPLLSVAMATQLLHRKYSKRHQNKKVTQKPEGRRLRATIMTLLFALLYIIFYSVIAVVYFLPLLNICDGVLKPGVQFSLSHGMYVMSGSNRTLEYYIHIWIYYSVFLGSTVNCIVHFTCNGVIRSHLRLTARRLQKLMRVAPQAKHDDNILARVTSM